MAVQSSMQISKCMNGRTLQNVPFVSRHFALLINYDLEKFLRVKEDVYEEAVHFFNANRP